MDQILSGEFPTEEPSSIYPSRLVLLARLQGAGHIPSTTERPSATAAIDALWVCAAAQVYDRVARAVVDFERLVNSDPIQRDAVLSGRWSFCRIFAVLNAVAGTFGPMAAYSSDIERILIANEFSIFERDEIERRLQNGFAWHAFLPASSIVGSPSREFLELHLADLGVTPSEAALDLVLGWLAIERCKAEAHAATLYEEARTDFELARQKCTLRRNLSSSNLPTPPFAWADLIERADGGELLDGVPPSPWIRTFGELLSKMVTNGLKGKTRSQYESVARSLETVAGTDRLAAIKPSHIAIYRIVLELIPKLHGRSPRDRLLSVAEIIKEADGLAPNQVGLTGRTINRHLSQLNGLMQAARSESIDVCCPQAVDALRAPAPSTNSKSSAEHSMFRNKAFTDAVLGAVDRETLNQDQDEAIQISELDFCLAERLHKLVGNIPGTAICRSPEGSDVFVTKGAMFFARWRQTSHDDLRWW
jgi:hypothetical protein